MHTIFQEGVTGVWFDLEKNEHVPCGTSKRIYLENGGLHVTDSGQNATITFAISRKKLLRLGLTLVFAACVDLRGILFRNVLTIVQGQSPQLGQVGQDKDITFVECVAPTFAEADDIARNYKYIRTGANMPASTPAGVNSCKIDLACRMPANRTGRILQE